MNFFSDLQHDYEDKASKWLVNFQGPNFDIPEELKENVGLIGAMCEVSRLQSIDTSDHLTQFDISMYLLLFFDHILSIGSCY